MAKLVLRDCFILINGTNFSDHVSSVTVALSKKGVDTTSFSGGGAEQVAGLKSDEFDMELQQDYAAASTDAVLYPLYNNETEFTIEVRPTSAARSVTNPAYTGTCVLLDYTPLDGKPGDLSNTKIKFPTQRTGITRATS